MTNILGMDEIIIFLLFPSKVKVTRVITSTPDSSFSAVDAINEHDMGSATSVTTTLMRGIVYTVMNL